MGVRITDVKISTDYSFEDVKNLGEWGSLKETQEIWATLLQTTTAGRPIKIEVEAREINWLDISKEHLTWDAIKNKFKTWLDIQNYR